MATFQFEFFVCLFVFVFVLFLNIITPNWSRYDNTCFSSTSSSKSSILAPLAHIQYSRQCIILLFSTGLIWHWAAFVLWSWRKLLSLSGLLNINSLLRVSGQSALLIISLGCSLKNHRLKTLPGQVQIKMKQMRDWMKCFLWTLWNHLCLINSSV